MPKDYAESTMKQPAGEPREFYLEIQNPESVLLKDAVENTTQKDTVEYTTDDGKRQEQPKYRQEKLNFVQ